MIAKITSGGNFRGVLEYLMQPKKESREAKAAKENERQPSLEIEPRPNQKAMVGRDEREAVPEGFAERLRGEKTTRMHKQNASEKEMKGEKKDRHRVIGGNMTGQSPRELAFDFEAFREEKLNIKKPVHHVSLSVSQNEKLGVREWNELAKKYVERMGFGGSPFVVIQHVDTENDHVHIVTSRVDARGKVVSEFQSKTRAERIVRDLEREHNLIQVKGSRDTLRAAPKRGELEWFKRTGELSAKMRLQGHVDVALRASRTATDFVENLNLVGVEVIPNLQSTGRISGISFRLGEEVMKGSNLGRGYSWNGLQRRGLEYEQTRDLTAFREAFARSHMRREQNLNRAAPITEPSKLSSERQLEQSLERSSLERIEHIKRFASQELMRGEFSRKAEDSRGIPQSLLTRQGSVEDLQRAAGIEPTKDTREVVNRLNETAGVSRAAPILADAREEEKTLIHDLTPAVIPEKETREKVQERSFILTR